LAPEGSWPASAGNDGKVRIWDPSTGATRHTLTGHGGEVWALGVPRTGPGWPLQLERDVRTGPEHWRYSHRYVSKAACPTSPYVLGDRSRRELGSYFLALYPGASPE
jgi:hypothetical protein